MARPIIDYTGKTIDGAKVLGRNRTEVQTQTKWDLRCLRCGKEFVCASVIIKERRHLHRCDDDRPAHKANTMVSAKATLRQSQETILPPPSYGSTPRAIPKRRPLSPDEIGLIEARNFPGTRGLFGNF